MEKSWLRLVLFYQPQPQSYSLVITSISSGKE